MADSTVTAAPLQTCLFCVVSVKNCIAAVYDEVLSCTNEMAHFDRIHITN